MIVTPHDVATTRIAEAIRASPANGFVTRTVAAGEHLVTVGEAGGEAFWVSAGRLEVLATDGSAVGHVGPGELVGEYTALVGGQRTATIRALDPSVVRVVTAEALESLLAADPDLGAAVRAESARRIHDTRLRQVLAAMLGDDSGHVVADLVARGVRRRLDAGEVLFTAGETARSAFVVISGRFREVAAGDASRSTGYLSAGSVVGEEGLAGGRRRVTLEAVRDSVVLEVGSEAFVDLLVEHPRQVAPLALALAGGVSPPRRQLDRTVAVAVTAQANPRQITSRIAEQMSALGTTAHLWSARIDSLLDRPGIAQALESEPGEIRLLDYLARAESDARYLLLEPDATMTGWSMRALSQADVLAVVASAVPDPAEQARIDELMTHAGPRTLRVLVLLQAPDVNRPQGTGELMSRFGVDHVLHARSGSVADIARVARTLAGRPVGLVLGGGGARGFTSLGVYRAMSALGIPVDAVGATSIGAPLGAGIALGIAPDEVISEAERLFHGILDYTLPLVSLLKGERTAEAIRARFDGLAVEDLWLPFFAISTNLTQGRTQIHRTGDVPTALRASVAIPGAFPPVPFGDDLLVDGGVTNNLPVDVMRRLYPTAEIVAVQAAPAKGPRAKADYGLSVSGWQAMKSKAGRGPRYPGLVAVLMRSMITGSLDRQEAAINSGAADLVLDLDAHGVGLLDFERVVEVADTGYEAAMPRLEAWLTERQEAGRGVPGVASHHP